MSESVDGSHAGDRATARGGKCLKNGCLPLIESCAVSLTQHADKRDTENDADHRNDREKFNECYASVCVLFLL
jgi:hypothetical protein